MRKPRHGLGQPPASPTDLASPTPDLAEGNGGSDTTTGTGTKSGIFALLDEGTAGSDIVDDPTIKIGIGASPKPTTDAKASDAKASDANPNRDDGEPSAVDPADG